MMIKTTVCSWVLFAAFATTLVTAQEQYLPCKGWLSFSYDDSNTLSGADFKTQMNFIKAALGKMNHPERLRVEAAYTGEFNWNSPLSLSQMQTAIDGAQQTKNSYSLAQQLTGLLTSTEVLGSTFDQISAVIFISDTSDAALMNADRWFKLLKNVNITFVTLGNSVDSSKLSPFSNSIVAWADLSKPQPDTWDSSVAFGCAALQMKCNNDIAILIDQSTALKNVTTYNKQIDFLTTSLIPSWNKARGKTYAMVYSSDIGMSISDFYNKTNNAFIADVAAARNQSLKGYDSLAVGFSFLLSQLQRLSMTLHDFTVIVFTYSDYMVDVDPAIPLAQQTNGTIIAVGVGVSDPFALSLLTKNVISTDLDFNGDVTAQINKAICG